MECTVSHAVEKINPDEREEMKVSGKVQPLQFILLYNGSDSKVLSGNKPVFVSDNEKLSH